MANQLIERSEIESAVAAAYCFLPLDRDADGRKRDIVEAMVDSGSFTDDWLGNVFSAAKAVRSKNPEFDWLSIREELIRRDKWDAGGFAEMMNSDCTWEFLSHYAAILRDQNGMRQVGVKLSGLARDAVTGAESSKLISGISELAESAPNAFGIDTSKLRTTDDLTADFSRQLDERINEPDTATIKTGYTNLDRVLSGGLRRSHLTVIGGRPGEGKTSMALNLVAQLSIEYRVLFASLEMDAWELTTRIASLMSGVPHHLMDRGRIDDSDKAKIDSAIKQINHLQFEVLDHPGCTMSQLEQAVHLNRPEILVVDHLTLIDVDEEDKKSDRYVQVGRISKGLKRLARRLKINVVALAQLRRDVEQKGRRPTKADLRESGDIEQDADEILLIHDKSEDRTSLRGDIDLIVEKNRGGSVGASLEFTFNKPVCRFDETEPAVYEEFATWSGDNEQGTF